MSSSPFVAPLQQLAELTGNRVEVFEDDHDGSRVLVICPRSQKVVTTVFHTAGDVEVLPHRVEGQNTMNCLSMQAIDMNEPFNEVDILSKDILKETKELFEDHLQSVYHAHHKLQTNGYRLWRSDLVFQCNHVMVRNIYVRSEQINEEKRLMVEMGTVTLEAHISTIDLKSCFETYRYPDLYWDITIDARTARVIKANRYAASQNHARDMFISVKPDEENHVSPAIASIPSLAIMDAFNIKHVTGKHQTSVPGRIDTTRTFRCVDYLDNVFNLQITYNL